LPPQRSDGGGQPGFGVAAGLRGGGIASTAPAAYGSALELYSRVDGEQVLKQLLPQCPLRTINSLPLTSVELWARPWRLSDYSFWLLWWSCSFSFCGGS